MRMEFEMELPDAPGELSRVLQVVANHGANVLSVVHRHERAAGGRVPVSLSVEIDNAAALRMLDALARTHRLLRVNREGGPVQTAIMLVGHVFEADLRELLNAAFEHQADVSGVDARIAGRANPSAVLVKLSADDEGALRSAIDALRERAEHHRLQCYEQVGGEPPG